jgi:hypothetical protein
LDLPGFRNQTPAPPPFSSRIRRQPLLGRGLFPGLFFSRFSKPDTGATAVLADELDASRPAQRIQHSLPIFYRFFRGAFAACPRPAFAAGGLKASAVFTNLVRRTPGLPPLVNSTPAASSARCSASTVRSFNSSPRSNLATVSIDTLAAAASSLTPNPRAARAMRHWTGKKIIMTMFRFQLKSLIL